MRLRGVLEMLNDFDEVIEGKGVFVNNFEQQVHEHTNIYCTSENALLYTVNKNSKLAKKKTVREKLVISKNSILNIVRENGFIINTSKQSIFNVSLFEGILEHKNDGLVMGYENNTSLSSSKESIIGTTSCTHEVFYPSLWCCEVVTSKVYNLVQESNILLVLPELYAKCQLLMASAKISHFLCSIVHEESLKINYIWLCYDNEYYEKYIKNIH